MTKMTIIAILANGEVKNTEFLKSKIQETDFFICADGGANHARKIEMIPDCIIGDLDSISPENLTYFQNQKKTKIIKNSDQNKTDMELAIYLAQEYSPEKIMIFGALGKRIDHALANIVCLLKIPKKIQTSIIDEQNEIQIVRESIQFRGKKGDIISAITLSNVESLSYQGLYWDVQNENKPPFWIGICNKMLGKKAKINIKKGCLLTFRTKD